MTNPSTSRRSLRLRKLPARYATLTLTVMLSVLMTCVVSFISTLLAVGTGPALWRVWFASWGASWVVAFPTLLVALPMVRKATAAIVDVRGGPG